MTPMHSLEMLNTSQFGGNTGRQGIFDPENPNEKHMALQRLRQLYDDYGDKLQYNYTGDTGLQRHDRTGYAAWQNAITEADNIASILEGQEPKNMRFGGDMSTPRSAAYMPEPHAQFLARYGRG